MIKSMKTYQIKDKQTVFQHGVSVYSFYKDLVNQRKKNWKLPEWFLNNKDFIKENIHSEDIIRRYAVLHDCGKPSCITFDEFG